MRSSQNRRHALQRWPRCHRGRHRCPSIHRTSFEPSKIQWYSALHCRLQKSYTILHYPNGEFLVVEFQTALEELQSNFQRPYAWRLELLYMSAQRNWSGYKLALTTKFSLGKCHNRKISSRSDHGFIMNPIFVFFGNLKHILDAVLNQLQNRHYIQIITRFGPDDEPPPPVKVCVVPLLRNNGWQFSVVMIIKLVLHLYRSVLSYNLQTVNKIQAPQ